MQQKENNSSTLAEQSLKHDKRELSLEDKYVCLPQENQKLKQWFRKIWDVLSFWEWLALEAQAEETRNQCKPCLCGRGSNDSL